MLVVGDREQENGMVAVRNRKHGDLGRKIDCRTSSPRSAR